MTLKTMTIVLTAAGFLSVTAAFAQDNCPINVGLLHSAISDPSRRTVGVVLDALVASGMPEVPLFLERWQGKQVWQRDTDGLFFYVTETTEAMI